MLGLGLGLGLDFPQRGRGGLSTSAVAERRQFLTSHEGWARTHPVRVRVRFRIAIWVSDKPIGVKLQFLTCRGQGTRTWAVSVERTEGLGLE